MDSVSSLSLKAKTPATISTSFFNLSATDSDVINSQTSFLLAFKNVNPLPAGSNMIIIIPSEIGTT